MKARRAPGSALSSVAHVRLKQRRQVGVGGGGLAAGQHPHLAGDLRRGHHVGEAELPGDLDQPHLERRVRVGVDSDDRHRVEALSQRLGEGLPRHRLVEGLRLARRPARSGPGARRPARGADRLADLEIEELGPRLGSDLEEISQTPIGDQQRARTAPLEQRVGGHRGAELDACRAGEARPAPRRRSARGSLGSPPPAPRRRRAAWRCGGSRRARCRCSR